MKRLIVSLLIANTLIPCLAYSRYAQDSIRSLMVGDRMPDIELINLLNYKDSSLKLSDFAGKAIIIDFWATWCTPCVEKMPYIQAVQDKYKNQLQVISVAYEKTSAIKDFLSRINKNHKTNLLTATEDGNNYNNRKLLQYFPSSTVPRYIWIDKDRIVRGLSIGEGMADSNVAKLIAGVDVTARTSNHSNSTANPYSEYIPPQTEGFMIDIIRNMDWDAHIRKDFKECVIFTGPQWSVPGQHLVTSTLGILRSESFSPKIKPPFFVNREAHVYDVNLFVAYAYAFGRIMFQDTFPPQFAQGYKRFVVEVKDTVNRKWLDTPYDRSKTFCYMRITKDTVSKDSMLALMRNDFKDFFHIEGKVEKRNMDCFALSVFDCSKAKTLGDKPSVRRDPYGLKLVNQNIETLAQMLRLYNELYNVDNVIINESKWKGNIDIEIKCRLDDPVAVADELKKFGISYTPKKADVPVIVFYDAK